MINHDLKCIFVEVPKTASTSIRSIIGQPSKPHLNILQIREEFIRSQIEAAMDEKNDEESLIEAKMNFNNYFKFGFVRNPWDRVVSLFNRKEGLQLSERMSFEEFVGWIQNSSDTCLHPLQHKNQLDWFIDERGDVIVDYIGKFEELEKSWQYISQRLNVKKKLPHHNINEDKIYYKKYYNSMTKKVIEQKFKTDIEYFNYTF